MWRRRLRFPLIGPVVNKGGDRCLSRWVPGAAPQVRRDGTRQHETVDVVSVFADQIDPARRLHAAPRHHRQPVGAGADHALLCRPFARGQVLFEHLHPGPSWPQLSRLQAPGLDDGTPPGRCQFRQGQRVIGRETDHPTHAAGRRHPEQRVARIVGYRGIGPQGRKVIVEDPRAAVIRIGLALSARVARAQMASGAGGGGVRGRRIAHRWTLRAMATPCAASSSLPRIQWACGTCSLLGWLS